MVLLALLAPTCLVAQSPSIEPPLLGRPPQFSNIVGSYRIAVTAEPAEVPLEEPITLRVRIEGNGPAKYQPSRKHLKLFPERWAKDFYVEPVPDADRALPGKNTWEFVYRLRPKHQQVTAIDGIKLVYYEPGKTGGGKYQTDYADPVALTVKPRRPAPIVPDHLPVRTLPASFYELPDADAMLAPRPSAVRWPTWLLALLLVVPPIATIAAVRAWQRRFPGGARRHPSNLAARRALQALRDAAGEPAWVVLGRYLRERLEFPAEEPTPAEVRRFLRGAARPGRSLRSWPRSSARATGHASPVPARMVLPHCARKPAD